MEQAQARSMGARWMVATVLLVPAQAVAQPAISSVSGPLHHGGTVVVEGTSFGTKEPAAPLIWDDTEGRTLEQPAAVLQEGGWDESWAGPSTASAVRTPWQLQYRAAGFRSVEAPHAHSQSYVTGGHWSDSEDAGRNVALTRDFGTASNDWYASWYVRLDPRWPEEDGHQCTLVPNYKDYVFQEAGMSYTGSFDYSACTSCIVRRQPTITVVHQWLCGGDPIDPAPRPSEAFGWKRREVVLRNEPGMLRSYSYDGAERVQAYDVTCPAAGRLETFDVRSFTVGGFMKNSDSSGDPPYDYPNWSPIRDLTDDWYIWVQRGTSDEYYATFDGSAVGDSSPDPWIRTRPAIVRIDGVDSTTEGTLGSLAPGEWAWGDGDGLGFDTIYVRLPASATDRNPGSNGPCYLVLTDSAASSKGNGRTHPDAFRYFDDLYVDTSLARVVLANAPSYGAATIVEPQIPVTWSDTQVEARVNLGALPDSGTAYLCVFDANDEPSEPCAPVELSGGGGQGGSAAGGAGGSAAAGGTAAAGGGSAVDGGGDDGGCGCVAPGHDARARTFGWLAVLALGLSTRRARAVRRVRRRT